MKAGWQTIRFCDLGRVFNGNSISEAEKKKHFAGQVDGLPYIATKDVRFDHSINYESGIRIPEEKQRDFKLAPANTVLVCAEGGSAGRKIAHSDTPIFFGNKLFAISPSHPHNSRFVFYYCLSSAFSKQFRAAMAGLIGGVSINKFKELTIQLPSAAEQHRIVAILDEAFEGVATAKANAEKNLQNARALFESHLHSMFTERGEGWVEVSLENCCDQIFAGGDVPKGSVSQERTAKFNVPIFSNGAKDDGLYGFTENARVMKPSITISARGTIGYTVIRTEPFLPVVRLIVLIPDEQSIELSFLYYAVLGMDFGNTGTSIPQLTVPNLKGRKLHLPPLPKQRVIVARLDEIREETQRLESVYQQKLTALDDLKKSLLQQAFSGAL